MKKYLLPIILLCPVLIYVYQIDQPKQHFPQPINTIVKLDMEDGSKSGRKQWIEDMHLSAPGTDWEEMEYQNAIQNAKYKSQLRNDIQSRDPGEEESIVEGYLAGVWYERGSSNQAGSVIKIQYIPELDQILTVSAGGTLWQGDRDGSEWKVLNQDYIFYNNMLEVHDVNGIHRLISAIGGRVHYSDDMGLNWIMSTGINTPKNGWRIRDVSTIKNNNGEQELFFFGREDWWSNIQLYRSVDNGVSFEKVAQFNTSDFNNLAMNNPHGTEDIYILEQISSSESKLIKWNKENEQLAFVNANAPFSFMEGKGNLVGAMKDGILKLYAYRLNDDDNNQVFVSEDEGTSWQPLGILGERPWDVGLYISPSDPDNLFTGGVDGYRSHDGGNSWILKNNWWEYYDLVESKLHADIMDYAEFVDPDGNPFLLNSNHGGMYISYDQGRHYQNIGLNGLNVGQYYSVRSHPSVPEFVYAGAQDQGFQRGQLNPENTASNFEQVISGDYGHIIFTDSGNRLWTVYPGGWVTYYRNPLQGGITDTYEVISPDESVWIPPMMAHPDPTKNIAYIAGGNVDELPGYHIIQMEVVADVIQATALPFDFYSYGAISAMEVNPMDHNKWYVATDSGKFLYSEDGGNSFIAINATVPGGNYLYGSDILASSLDPNVLYLSGSGYSNPGVIKSIDGGLTFQAMNKGLPNTMVFSIATNEDESLIFASTEAGPYVYIVEIDEWFNLSGTSAPLQTYWSVEYIASKKIARFGTYGRGVWDFEVTGTTPNDETIIDENNLRLYPNPSRNILNIKNNKEDGLVSIMDSYGRIVLQKEILSDGDIIDIEELSTGNYYLMFKSVNIQEIKQFVKID